MCRVGSLPNATVCAVTIELAVSLALGSLLLAITAVILTFRLVGQARLRLDEALGRLHSFDKQLKALEAGAVGLGHRVVAMEQTLLELSEGREDMMGHSGEQLAYTQAMQMFDQGADVDTVVSSCGLSNSEAQLMALVRSHLKHKTPPTAPTAGRKAAKS